MKAHLCYGGSGEEPVIDKFDDKMQLSAILMMT